MKQSKNILCVVLIALTQFVIAQTNSFDDWRAGKVYLNNGDTLSGFVIYEEGHEIVQYSDTNIVRVKTFSAFVLTGFEQSIKEETRVFTRFYWNKGYEHAQKIPDFFEIMYDGENKLLSKDRRVTVMDDMGGASFGLSVSAGMLGAPMYVERIERSLYIRLENGNMYSIYKPKKDFLNLFPEKKEKLKKHFKNNRITPDNIEKIINVIRLIEGKKQIDFKKLRKELKEKQKQNNQKNDDY